MTLPSPIELGAPEKFAAWRKSQESALLYPINCEERVVLQSMPTGFGKSLTVVGRAMLTGNRTVILTVTKGLQRQYADDFTAAGLTDIRGMNSYPCIALSRGNFGDPIKAGCDEGPCRHGVTCKLKQGNDQGERCLYFAALDAARKAQIVVTNYAYWLNINAWNEEGLGEFDELVLDEAHEAVGQLASFLAIEIDRYECESVLNTRLPSGDIKDWRDWARVQHGVAATAYDEAKQEYKELMGEGGKVPAPLRSEIRMLSLLKGKLKRIADIVGQWIVIPQKRGAKLEPVWPAPYAEKALFRGIPKVNLISGTLHPKTAQLLGITEYAYCEYPSTFPPKRRPVIHIPTVRLTHRSSDEDKQVWLRRMDQLIAARLDRKGIIHTVSYSRQKMILEQSKYSKVMMVNVPGSTLGVVDRFKESDAPRILVSPALSTGWDFPGDECEYQIIAKIPFPDSSDPVVAARSKSDPDYAGFIAMTALVQMAGRGSRYAEDQCEIFIIDDNATWFMYKFRKFAPRWFLNAVRWVRRGDDGNVALPLPPPSLAAQRSLAIGACR